MLPDPNFRWEESENGAFLQWRYKCVALTRTRKPWESFCRVEIFTRPPIISRAGSVEQGKRHIERWLAKQERFPMVGAKMTDPAMPRSGDNRLILRDRDDARVIA